MIHGILSIISIMIGLAILSALSAGFEQLIEKFFSYIYYSIMMIWHYSRCMIAGIKYKINSTPENKRHLWRLKNHWEIRNLNQYYDFIKASGDVNTCHNCGFIKPAMDHRCLNCNAVDIKLRDKIIKHIMSF